VELILLTVHACKQADTGQRDPLWKRRETVINAQAKMQSLHPRLRFAHGASAALIAIMVGMTGFHLHSSIDQLTAVNEF